MDTFTTYSADGMSSHLIDSIEDGLYFTPDDREIAQWMDLTRRIVELNQLYDVYCWNHSQLVNGISAQLNDVICNVRDNSSSNVTDHELLIALNGYTMNMVSAGANLIEAQRAFCDHEVEYGMSRGNAYTNTIAHLFNKDVPFRLVNGLRNLSQHGQLIVSVYKGDDGFSRACFDAHQLRNPSSFTLKSWQEHLLDSFIEQVKGTAMLPARLSFTCEIDVYNYHVHNLHALFLESAKDFVGECVHAVEERLRSEQEKVLFMQNGTQYSLLLDGKEAHILVGVPKQFVSDYEDRLFQVRHARDIAKNNMEETVGYYHAL